MTEKKPEDSEITKDDKDVEALTKKIDLASSNAGKTYLIYIGFLAYSALTIAGVSGADLFLKNKIATLPIVNIEIALNTFLIIAPILGILVFIYLQLYINRLCSLDRELPNDKVSKYQRLYPWWMIDIAGVPETQVLKKLQKLMSVFSLWLLLPITLCIFAVRLIIKPEPFYFYYAVAMLLVGSLWVLWFWSRYDSEQKESFSILDIYRSLLESKTRLIFTIIIALVILFLSIIPWVNRDALKGSNPVARFLSYAVSLNLDKADLSGADLRIANLENSNLEGADLAEADLRGAKLKGANLEGAKLEGAENITSDQLCTAKTLYKAKLDSELREEVKNKCPNHLGAYLVGAHLTGADLYGADLEGANLREANLVEANLWNANLRKAYLVEANLGKADLYRADLSGADLSVANLRRADLRRANLEGANLQGANLQRADLIRANLRRADLGKAINITSDQLCKADTLFEATMDSELQEKVKKEYPELLVEAKRVE